MFSFPTDDRKNRALIKVGNSEWSKPQSFDAIGSTYSVTLQSASGRQEMDIGVEVEEGEGKVSRSQSQFERHLLTKQSITSLRL